MCSATLKCAIFSQLFNAIKHRNRHSKMNDQMELPFCPQANQAIRVEEYKSNNPFRCYEFWVKVTNAAPSTTLISANFLVLIPMLYCWMLTKNYLTFLDRNSSLWMIIWLDFKENEHTISEKNKVQFYILVVPV